MRNKAVLGIALLALGFGGALYFSRKLRKPKSAPAPSEGGQLNASGCSGGCGCSPCQAKRRVNADISKYAKSYDSSYQETIAHPTVIQLP